MENSLPPLLCRSLRLLRYLCHPPLNNNRADTVIIPCIAVLFAFVETNRVRSMGSPMETYAPYWHPQVVRALQDLDNCLNKATWGRMGVEDDGFLACSVPN